MTYNCLNELLRSYLIKKKECLLCGDMDKVDIFDCGISAIMQQKVKHTLQ